MTEVKKISIQIRPPKGTFTGEIAEGWYVVFENNVILTDQDGKPLGPKRHMEPSGDAHLLACLMVRNNRKGRASVSGFNRRISYPPMKF
jgi:hypothetical protein